MESKRKHILWITIIISCVIVLLIASILCYAIYFPVQDKVLLISIVGLYLVVWSCMLKTRYQDYRAYCSGRGKLLQEPPVWMSLFGLSASVILLLFYGWMLYQESAQFTMLILPLILHNVGYINDYEMILVDQTQLYIHHKWIPYCDIRKIDTDCSVKKYVTVYVFSHKTYTKRLEPKLYACFEKEISKYYTNEYRKPK